jgi:hypothetical protein
VTKPNGIQISEGATTSREIIAGASSKRFHRVRAIRPLLP